MNYSTAVFLINDKVRAVKAQYEPGGGLTIFKTLDQGIKVDDLVVVPTDTRHKMTVVKVLHVDVDVDMDSNVQLAWVVTKLDLSDYDRVLEEEKKAIEVIRSAETRKRRNELRANIFKDQEEKLNDLALASDSTQKIAAPIPVPGS